jgi:hypothetical protein
MAWPKPVDALWRDLESVRAELLREVEGLSQRQAEWLAVDHDHTHLGQVRDGKRATGFPAA